MGHTIAFVVVGPWLTTLLFGSEFSQSAELIVWLIPSVSAIAIVTLIDESLKGMNYASPGSKARVLGNATLIALALALVPMHGAYGLAYALVCKACIELVVILVAAGKICDTPVRKFFDLSPASFRAVAELVRQNNKV